MYILLFLIIFILLCLILLNNYFYKKNNLINSDDNIINNKNLKKLNQKKIVIGFMIRNGEEYLEKNLDKIIDFFNKYVNNYEIIYIENDSNDNTNKILNNFKNKYKNISGENLILNNDFSTKLCNKGDGYNCNKRTRFLASLRQKLLDKVIKDFNHFDYYLLLDFDFIHFDEKELLKFLLIFTINNYDGIFPISLNSKCLDNTKKINYNNDKCSIYDYGAINNSIIKNRSIRHIQNNKIEKVKSAFSGFGLYSIKSIIKKNAKYNLKCNTIEHIDFNKKFKKLYMYHSFTPIY